MESEKFEGFANFETFCVYSWLANERGTNRYWRRQARKQLKRAPDSAQVKEGTWTKAVAAKFNLADQLERELNEAAPIGMLDMYTELMMAGLDRVEWAELAETFLADMGQATPTSKEGAR